MNSTKCPLPWIQVAVLPNSKVRPCCYAGHSDFLNQQNTNASQDTLPSESIELSLQTELLKKIRHEMTSDFKPKSCDYCYDLESKGIKSKRQSAVDTWGQPNTEKLKILDLRASRKCNLNCIMCSAEYSTSWDILNSRLNSSLEPKASSETKLKYSFDSLKHLEEIQLAGGEPFLEKNNLELLQFCVENQISHKVHLKINSNCTIISEHWLKVLSKFKSIHLMASIDGYQEQNNLLRPPSRWQSIILNLTTFKKFLPLATITSVTTVHTENCFNLFQTLEWLQNLKLFKHNSLNVLVHPVHLSVQHLNLDQKKQALDQVSQVRSKLDLNSLDLQGLSLLEAELGQTKFSIEIENQRNKFVKVFHETTFVTQSPNQPPSNTV